ncbi:magnesium-translocating P-type ATPase [Streptomyces sp. NPDC021093]|uniref:magnesium-translocating P-type ATPase n=1 Tax=Streptomyces sp. NPDC021093 TaxID=3365112 RepID=UPI0037B7B1C2
MTDRTAASRTTTAGPHAPVDRTAAPTTFATLRALDSSPRGLTEEAAAARLVRHGPNTPPARRAGSWPRRLARSLRDPFTMVLFFLGLVSATVASWGTACVILVLVAVSCVLRSLGEHRADRALDLLRGRTADTVSTRRRDDEACEGRVREVPVDDLVPGDVILLGPGDLVPADVRLLRSQGLSVHQAALTGESAPVDKSANDLPTSGDNLPASGNGLPARADGLPAAPGTGVFVQPRLCFQGSGVASGSGTAVVLATGADTHFAAVHRATGRPSTSAFDRSVHGLSWTLIRFLLITPPLVLLANAALYGRGLETLPFAVAVAVGLTPEMLPVVVTNCLARGAARLARTHGVIVKRLPALHDLGAADVLCLDKTGTLTQDRPVLARALDACGREDPGVLHWAAVNSWWTLQLAEIPAPDALDEALLDVADPDELMAYDGVSALPRDPGRRLSTAVLRTPGALGSHTLVVKGAPEAVLERCALPAGQRAALLADAAREAASGLRVLAVATAERRAGARPVAPADERGLTFRGFVTFTDAVQPSAGPALARLAERGVTFKVLTGDHPGTAVRACRDLGVEPGVVRTGAEIDATADDAELAALARDTIVFARCTPLHKARVVTALRSAGHTTGFLGDGVNDLPALYAADVGCCPQGAADVARESADVVLATKDLASLEHAVTAGRASSANIASYLRVTLSSNLGNVIAMLVAGLLLPFLPMLPAQVLVQNLCFDAAQLSFAHDHPDPAALRRPAVLRPRALLRFVTGFGLLGAVADFATFAVLAVCLPGSFGLGDEVTFHSGWFTENLLTQALVMVMLRTGRRAVESRTPGVVPWAATALAATGVLLPLSPVGPLLGMSGMPAVYYPLVGAVLVGYAAALFALRGLVRRRADLPDAAAARG